MVGRVGVVGFREFYPEHTRERGVLAEIAEDPEIVFCALDPIVDPHLN